MLLGIVIISINNILSTQAQMYIKVMWSIVVLGLCTSIIFLLTKMKTAAVICMIATAGLAVMTVVMQSAIIPYCGDGMCSQSECSSGCNDCQASQCENRVCEPPIENCANSIDCRCAHGYACAPTRNGSNTLGCMLISCGDGFCDAAENTVNCCDDCGCPVEHTCKQHACYFTPPIIALNTKMVDSKISVTTLVGNPQLPDVNGTPRPLVGLFLESPNYLRDLQLNFSLGKHLNDTIIVGDIPPNNKIPVLWYSKNNLPLLSITQDNKINVTITAIFKDVTGEQRTQLWIYPITLLGRNSLDKQGNIVLYVTHDYVTASNTPESIWSEIQNIVKYKKRDDNKILFPAETLARGYGNRNDLAVLVASAYDIKNLSPSIVQSSDGYYVRVRTKNRFVILDTSLIEKSFQEAIVQKPGSAVYDIDIERRNNNFTLISLNDSFIPEKSLTYNSTTFQSCPCDNICWTKASAEYTLTNNGISILNMCATSQLFGKQNKILDVRTNCYNIDPQSSIIMRHGWTNTIGCINVTSKLNVTVIHEN